MSFTIGVILALAVCAFASVTRFDRDGAFYPTVLIIVALYNVLFAVMGGSTHALLLDSAIAAAFVVAAAFAFEREPLFVALGLAAHGALDSVHGGVVENAGVPRWWPAFCCAFDITAAVWVAWKSMGPRLSGRTRGVAALLLLGFVPAIAHSQTIDATGNGSRVRVDLLTTERASFGRVRTQSLIGALASVQGDTMLLAVRPGGDLVRVPHSTIRAAFVSEGLRPRWQSALRGAIAPALIGAALSAASSSIRRRPGDPSPMSSALSSAAWGATSGALLGAWSPKERWRALSLVR